MNPAEKEEGMKILLLCVVLLAGCADMTNEQIITEVKKCEKANLKARQVQNIFTYQTSRVTCVVNQSSSFHGPWSISAN